MPSGGRDGASMPSDSRIGSDSRFGSDSRYGSDGIYSDSRAGSDDRTSPGVPGAPKVRIWFFFFMVLVEVLTGDNVGTDLMWTYRS